MCDVAMPLERRAIMWNFRYVEGVNVGVCGGGLWTENGRTLYVKGVDVGVCVCGGGGYERKMDGLGFPIGRLQRAFR
jgi:hypothetical protein